MIETITIKKIATYNEVGIHIENLKKVNFIYGANGSGKTTITKCIDNPADSIYCNCSIIWKNGMPMKALVYNKDFRDRNFGKGNLEGVFTLGQATKEQIENINEKQNQLEETKIKGTKKKEALEKVSAAKLELENDFKEVIWFDVYKSYESDFKEAFIGVMRKDAFKSKVLYEYKNNAAPLKTYEELKEKAKTIFGETPIVKPLITVVSFERLLEIENHNIWTKKIIGKTDISIAQLIQKLNLNDWVNTGRSYLQDNEICPFCQTQSITKDFRSQLEEYFDETFTTETKLVKSLSNEFFQLGLNVTNVLLQIEAAEKANADTKLNIETFSAYLNTLSTQFISNRELLNNKIKEPSRTIDLISVKDQLENIQQLIAKANEEINTHNAIVANFALEKSMLINEIWKFLIEKNRIKIEAFNKRENGFQRGIDALEQQQENLRKKYKLLQGEIREANKNVTSIQPSVDEINRTLKSYGFHNFEIVPSQIGKNQYEIKREDGTFAEATLSEGEITFITFLYYLQLAKGSTLEDTISEDRILVVDDPISSLDSSVLFVVSALLKRIIKSIKKGEGFIKQLILLTHNVYFHKEVSFLDGRTMKNNDTFYWILRRKNNISAIQNCEMENPVQNSYELLWQELRNREGNSGITIQNTMRRIIENYFKILGKYGDDDLIQKFDNTEEQEICRSLICWINDGSHCIPDDLFIEEQEAIIDKYSEVFKEIFIKTGHLEHYNMMMRTLSNSMGILN